MVKNLRNPSSSQLDGKITSLTKEEIEIIHKAGFVTVEEFNELKKELESLKIKFKKNSKDN